MRYIIYGIYLRYYILIFFYLWIDLEYILFYYQYLILLYFSHLYLLVFYLKDININDNIHIPNYIFYPILNMVLEVMREDIHLFQIKLNGTSYQSSSQSLQSISKAFMHGPRSDQGGYSLLPNQIKWDKLPILELIIAAYFWVLHLSWKFNNFLKV